MKIKFLFIAVILMVAFGFFSFSKTNNLIINMKETRYSNDFKRQRDL